MPRSTPPPPQTRLHVVGAAIVADGRCLVAQRGPAMSLPLAWEFPGGKVEVGEDPRSALAREVGEELSLQVEVGDHLGRGVAGIVTLDIYVASVSGGALALTEHADSRWIEARDIDSIDWAPADRPVLPALRRLLESQGIVSPSEETSAANVPQE